MRRTRPAIISSFDDVHLVGGRRRRFGGIDERHTPCQQHVGEQVAAVAVFGQRSLLMRQRHRLQLSVVEGDIRELRYRRVHASLMVEHRHHVTVVMVAA